MQQYHWTLSGTEKRTTAVCVCVGGRVSLVNLRGTPHLPREKRLCHSGQSPLLHRSRLGPSVAASSPLPPALPRPGFALLTSVSMVTVHKPPSAAGRAVSLQTLGAAERCDAGCARVGAEKETPGSTLSTCDEGWTHRPSRREISWSSKAAATERRGGAGRPDATLHHRACANPAAPA